MICFKCKKPINSVDGRTKEGIGWRHAHCSVMKTNYKFYSDPGHAWLAVPKVELKALGIEKEISSYSYQRGGTAYLEEDCDAGKFIDVIGKDNITIIEIYHDKTPIRSYDHYSLDKS